MRHTLDRHRTQFARLGQSDQLAQLVLASGVTAADGNGAQRNGRQRQREIAAIEADRHIDSASRQHRDARSRGVGRRDEVHHAVNRAARGLREFLGEFVGWFSRLHVDAGMRAGLARHLKLFVADIDSDNLPVSERHEDADGSKAQAAGADDDDGIVRLDLGKFSDRRIGGDAGAGIGRSQRRIDVLEVDQMLRLVDQHMRAVAAFAKYAEASRGQAHLVVAGKAMLALSASGPRVHQPMVADGDAFGVRPERHHLADGLVAGNEGQRDATVLERQPLAATEIVVAVLKIEIAVADAAIGGLEKNLSA